MRKWLLILSAVGLVQLLLTNQGLAEVTHQELQTSFDTSAKPFFETYCYTCHNKTKSKGDLDLTAYPTMDSIAGNSKRWQKVLEKLKKEEMPPDNAKKQPTPQLRKAAIAFVMSVRHFAALRNAGDPGIVLAHRLSNAEYDYTIRDLTGVDIHPTHEFPVDPANLAGFDNSGESLDMSPALLKKYMEAARKVSEYLVFKPDGLSFAPFPLLSETDRDKYCVNRIIDFYHRQPTELSDYFFAAWTYEHRASFGQANASLSDIAAKQKVSARYLAKIDELLTGPAESIGPIAALQGMWKALPPDAAKSDAAREGCQSMAKWVLALRQKVRPKFSNLGGVYGMQAGSQPLVLWKDRQLAKTRLTYAPGSALKLTSDDLGDSPAMAIPKDASDRDKYEDAFKRFCTVIPDEFVVTERARVYLDPKKEAKLTGRLLSAGFHSQMGYFRDDGPLCDLILDTPQKAELDKLWKELDYISDVPRRTFQGMIWFERSDSRFMRTTDFDFVRAEERDILSAQKLPKIRAAFLAKANADEDNPVAIKAIEEYFDEMNTAGRWLDRAREAAEPKDVAALQDIAQRAYRRPLLASERNDIAAFYQSLRTQDHLDHEDAIRDTLVSILMSPYFCYQYTATPASDGVVPLTDYELASRLSYFLWSSMPDKELLGHAAAGDLHKPEVLVAQARRMMRDSRIVDFATEFGGNWLDFRRFEQHNGVDRDRFKTFDNDLREAMYQEPVHFLTNLVREDCSVLDCLYGNYTFVNPQLARHYGMPEPDGSADDWVRIDNAHQYQRGGLLPMAVFLTQNSPGLRTSPVKRGNWLVKRVLGEEIAPPPPNVPALPTDESKLGNLTLPQILAQHRQDRACATCHEHFDSIGLSFEGFGPIGELRKLDLGGKPVENHATFPDGSEGTGLEGLLQYIRTQRQDDFVDNLDHKLLAYALGRTLLSSDDLLLEQMQNSLQASNYRFSTLVETIVTSPQFLNKRGKGALARGS